jgi:hypothetical protein
MIPWQQPAREFDANKKIMHTSRIANKNLFFTINPPLLPKPETAE